MAAKANQMFLNLPVKDLGRSMEFFSRIGFEFDEQFTTEDTACLVLGDNIFAMISTEERFKGFTKKEIPDTSAASQMIIALSVSSRSGVDEVASKAVAAGAAAFNDPVDHGFMYVRGFKDLDGHLWEVLYMDVEAMAGA